MDAGFRMSGSSYVDSHKDPAKGRQYDAYYESDPWARYLWSREQEVLTQALELYFGKRSVRALDFACGTGRICSFLETRVAACTGVDVSEAMLGQARAKLQRTTLHAVNLLENPARFAPGSFDLITAFRFFVNAEPALRRAAVRALAPLLAPDGCFIFNNHQNINAPYMRVTRAYAGWRGYQAFNVLSIAECRALMADVGLEIVHVFPVGMFRLPKLELPSALYRLADRLAGAADFSARWSMSPILVARRRA